MAGPASLVDSRLEDEAPGADAHGGGMAPIRAELAMRAMCPPVQAAVLTPSAPAERCKTSASAVRVAR